MPDLVAVSEHVRKPGSKEEYDEPHVLYACRHLVPLGRPVGVGPASRVFAGHAHALAAEIDKARLRQVIGTIADHDTVLAATQSAGQAREVARVLEQLAGLG